MLLILLDGALFRQQAYLISGDVILVVGLERLDGQLIQQVEVQLIRYLTLCILEATGRMGLMRVRVTLSGTPLLRARAPTSGLAVSLTTCCLIKVAKATGF